MRRLWLLGFLLCAGFVHAAGDVIAVSDFVGKPAEIGQEIAETLGTDLAKSERITLVERAQLGQALRELRLQHAGLTEPSQAKVVGKLVGADAVILGSFFVRENQIVINARVVDVRTGKVMAGRAENVQGRFNDLYNLLGDLANRLHLRMTGAALASFEPAGKGETENGTNLMPVDVDNDSDILFVVQNGWMRCTPDNNSFLPDKQVTVGDFARVLVRFASARRWEGKYEFEASRPGDLVNALRAVVALTRLALDPERLSEPVPAGGTLKLLPEWARPYVYQALQQGYIRDVEEASLHQIITRKQLAHLLTQFYPIPPGWPINETYTGLVIDAKGLGMRSSISPEVVDVRQRRIYPDPRRVPPLDYIQEYGIADFVKMEEQSKRAGKSPMYVKALAVQGAAKDRVVVSAEDAERIIEAEKESRFLKRWRVVFLVD